jgi:hypothetical protein
LSGPTLLRLAIISVLLFQPPEAFRGCFRQAHSFSVNDGGLSDADLAQLGRTDRYERNPDGSLIPLAVRRKPSDQLVLKMLSAHFPRTYGEKLEHQHSGIIAVMRIGRDGKMRPNSASIPKLENQSDELVVAADSGSADPTQMKIGMVVGERYQTSAELEASEAAMLATPASVEFRDEDVS